MTRGSRAYLASCMAAGVAISAVFGSSAQAGDESAYPTRPVRLVVSYAPGNVTDTLARLIAERLVDKWGQAVAVENRPGQGGSLGAQSVAQAPADGYTLLFAAMASMAINPHLYGNVGYNALKDFAPIINVAYPNSVMVVNPNLKINSLQELVDYSKANPTALNYGTAGNGTVAHLNTEALKLQSGLIAQHVPYKAANAVLTDLLGERIQFQQEGLAVLLPHIQANKLTALATGSAQRLPQLPDVPTIAEIFPGYQAVTPWLGIFAPAGTPQPIVAKINRDVAGILQEPAIQEKLRINGLNPVGDSAQAFTEVIANDYERLGTLVKQLGLKVD